MDVDHQKDVRKKRLGIAKMEPVKYITLTITKYLLKMKAPIMDELAEISAIDCWIMT